MKSKMFSQDELNRILAARIKRERERVSKEFENRLKRCMASVHLTLHQEMCAMKRDMATESDSFELGEELKLPKEAVEPVSKEESTKTKQGGEQK